METKHLPLEWKMTPEGVIEGYGAVFGNVDEGGDIIAPGAFAESLKSGRKVKMLREHCPDDLIGVWDDVSEDRNGLRVKGRLLLTIDDGRNAFELVNAKALDGLSIGYRTIESERTPEGTRLLKQLDLWEVSLVTFPMNGEARIDAVKALFEGNSAPIKRTIENALREAGCSHAEAKAGASAAANKIGSMRDAGANLDEVAALLKARIF